MPELPEVETVRRTLKNYIIGKKIENIQVYYNKIIEDDINEFKTCLIGQTFKDIDRYGKYLIFITEDYAFISHLRMEGKYLICDNDDPLNKHDHILFFLDHHQQLRYNDTRKFGRIKMVDKDHYLQTLPLNRLGKEPFQATVEEIYPLLHKKKIPIKHCLLDQSILTGIGNIYANEICFRMKISPYAYASSLSKKRVKELIDISSQVLNEAIVQGGTTIHSFSANGIDGLFQVSLNVHMQKTCPICGHAIVKEKIKGRGTYYCPHCQKRKR